MSTLHQYLTATGITQRAFAELAGVDPSIVSRLISNSMRPSLELAVNIERITDGQITAVSWIAPAPDTHP